MGRRPSFHELRECLGSKLYNIRIWEEGDVRYASYLEKGSFVVERKGKVTPGGVKLLAKYNRRGIVKVINERKAMLFLYGRDLFEGSFRVISKPCEKGFVLVYWDNILLGLGRLKGNMLINVIDFGEFLRRGV